MSELPTSRRTSTSKIYKIAFIVVFFAVFCAGLTLSSWLVVLACKELLSRVLSAAEERRHVGSRYASYWDLVSKLRCFSWPAQLLMLVACLSHVFLTARWNEIEYPREWWRLAGILLVASMCMDLVDIGKNSVSDSVFLDGQQGLDYGSGMAQNFFYGYLRLCLPDTGDKEKGIVERIDDFIAKQKLPPDSFPAKKLFVLIPSSTYLPNDLKDASYKWMQHQGTLEKQVKNRAGVIERVYKNSVYRIKDPDRDDGKDIYVVAEGATPCKTLYEVVQYSGRRKDLYVEKQNEILFKFHQTLVETLNEHEECKDLCEFIYYIDKEESGERVNVASLIMERVNQIQEKKQEMALRHRRQLIQ